MSYNLFLDKIRNPDEVNWVELPKVNKPTQWTVVRNPLDFKLRVTSFGLPEFVSFAHNLSPEHSTVDWSKFTIPDYNALENKTGYDCACWLIDYCAMYDRDFPSYQVHSRNTIGGEHIHSAVWAYKRWRCDTRPNHIK